MLLRLSIHDNNKSKRSTPLTLGFSNSLPGAQSIILDPNLGSVRLKSRAFDSV